MMRKALSCIIILILSAGIACSQEYRVRKIAFSGFRQVSVRGAKKTMLTRFPSAFFWNKGPALDEAVLRQDVRGITSYLKNEGYFDASVDYSLKYEGSSADISITAKEGLPYYVEGTTITAEGAYPPPEIINGLLKKITVKTGRIFKPGPFDKTRKEFEDYLKKSGYGSASVSGKVIIDRTAHSAVVVFSVAAGPLQYFGPVTITNNNYVKPWDIIAEASFREGDKFLAEKLEETRANIYGLDLFRSVTVTPVSSTGTIIPVEISVIEKKKRDIKIGAGYGTEDNFRIQGSWSRYYLSDKPRILTLSAKNSSIISDLMVSLAQPYFINKETGFTGTFSMDKEDVTSYTNEKTTAFAKIDRKFLESLTAFTGWNLEVDRPMDIKVDISQELLATLPDKNYFISGLLLGASYNSVKTLLPQNGVIYSALLESAYHFLGSEVEYTKGVLEGQNFVKLNDRIVLAARIKYGFIQPHRETKEIPIFKRFFSGGSYSVRGYGFHEIGPKDDQGTPLGGHYLFEYGLELQQSLSPNVNLVLFLDAGEVFNAAYTAAELKYGTGLGLRYGTTVGPIGLDIGFPVTPGNRIDTRQFKLYFSLGQPF